MPVSFTSWRPDEVAVLDACLTMLVFGLPVPKKSPSNVGDGKRAEARLCIRASVTCLLPLQCARLEWYINVSVINEALVEVEPEYGRRQYENSAASHAISNVASPLSPFFAS